MHDPIARALQSARLYYDYLEREGKGIETIEIHSIQPQGHHLKLLLRHKLHSPEHLQCLLHDSPLLLSGESRQLEVASYDPNKNLLELHLLDPALVSQSFTPTTLKLVSDLKFLIHNLIRHLERYGEQIAFPFKAPKISPTPPSWLNASQKEALRTIFESPFSYIWGAPGTGKTKAVLFESLMAYLLAGKRIAVLAPTNNALEQILFGLLPKFHAIGLDMRKILRIGTPGGAFLERYPLVCEPRILERHAPARQIRSLFEEEAEEESPDPKGRIKQAKLLACTLDGFILRDDVNALAFDHLFLDEAGFASCIKALPLCKKGVPLTLLGDHKQLPPICEMDSSQIRGEHEDVCLFDLSSLHLETLFFEPHTLHTRHQTHVDPEFTQIRKADLLQSHRYGHNLAALLDAAIYRNGLCASTHQESTQMFYVDSGAPQVQGNVNLAEVAACEKLLAWLRREGEEDFGFLTPFVNQRRALQKILPYPLRQERALTIHRAQGREFDTVIFSPVTLSRFLTDSRHPGAQKALNVAISRTKKRLILVCSHAFWSRQHNQLITDLLNIATPLHL